MPVQRSAWADPPTQAVPGRPPGCGNLNRGRTELTLRAGWGRTCPPWKWVDLPMLLPGHLTESGHTPADRTAITEIRSDRSEEDHHAPAHPARRGGAPG